MSLAIPPCYRMKFIETLALSTCNSPFHQCLSVALTRTRRIGHATQEREEQANRSQSKGRLLVKSPHIRSTGSERRLSGSPNTTIDSDVLKDLMPYALPPQIFRDSPCFGFRRGDCAGIVPAAEHFSSGSSTILSRIRKHEWTEAWSNRVS